MTARSVLLTILLMLALVPRSRDACAQGVDETLGRRAGGLQAGTWNVKEPAMVRLIQPTYRGSMLADAYFRRGLTEHMTLESSLSFWRRISERPSGDARPITTHTYIVPLLTSIRVYPLTTIRNRFEPYLIGGAGLAVGAEQQSENAIGGGGRTIAIGFGLKGGVGVEIHVLGRFGITLGAHLQGVRFGEAIDEQEAFAGGGFVGGLNYRFGY